VCVRRNPRSFDQQAAMDEAHGWEWCVGAERSQSLWGRRMTFIEFQ
jgi:hypothetical protein